VCHSTLHLTALHGAHYNDVMLLKAGERLFVFPVDSEGRVLLKEMCSPSHAETYRMGSGISRLMARDNSLHALDRNGDMMILRPMQAEGEDIETTEATGAWVEDGLPLQGSTLIEEDSYLIIDDVKMEKKRN